MLSGVLPAIFLQVKHIRHASRSQLAAKMQTITKSSRASIKASAEAGSETRSDPYTSQHHKSKPTVQHAARGREAFCWLKASKMNKRLNSGKKRILSRPQRHIVKLNREPGSMCCSTLHSDIRDLGRTHKAAGLQGFAKSLC